MPMRRWLGDHSLSLSFALLFLVSVAAQSVSGYFNFNSELALHGFPRIGYGSYLGTGNFLDGIFTNWQAALLQLGCLVVFAAKFREKGAAHSFSLAARRHKLRNPGAESRSWVFRHSLSLALAALFALSFIAHLFFGTVAHNSEMRMIHRQPVTTMDYGLSPAFWFATMQTWEAEFAAIAMYVLLSVFLRQQGSPESKPLDSSNEVTGKTDR